MVSEGRIELHGKRWRVTWQIDGMRQRKSFSSVEMAEQFAAEVDAAADARRERSNESLTVSGVVDTYIEHRTSRIQASTLHHYRQLVDKHVHPKIGVLDAREVTEDPAILSTYYDSLPPTTAKHVHQILRPAFQLAVDRRLLDRNPATIARPRRPEQAEKLIPSPEEVAKIVTAAFEADPSFGLWVWILSRLGLRRSEACALRWEDFDAERGLVHIRRNIARRKGGTYIKRPKSGIARTLKMNADFFRKLEPFRRPSGWVFPRGDNCPYINADELPPHSTPARLLVLLDEHGGALRCPDGRAGTEAARLLGLGRYSAGPMLRWLDDNGYVRREATSNRTFSIELTETARSVLAGWAERSDEGLPIFPTTMNAKFKKLMAQLGMPYVPHCLRHFVATHMYNRHRDWVQLARFLGHTHPSITMGLYSNHVIEASQLALADAAMDLYDDPLLEPFAED